MTKKIFTLLTALVLFNSAGWAATYNLNFKWKDGASSMGHMKEYTFWEGYEDYYDAYLNTYNTVQLTFAKGYKANGNNVVNSNPAVTLYLVFDVNGEGNGNVKNYGSITFPGPATYTVETNAANIWYPQIVDFGSLTRKTFYGYYVNAFNDEGGTWYYSTNSLNSKVWYKSVSAGSSNFSSGSITSTNGVHGYPTFSGTLKTKDGNTINLTIDAKYVYNIATATNNGTFGTASANVSSIEEGETVTLTATETNGIFQGWSRDGGNTIISGTSDKKIYTVTLDGNAGSDGQMFTYTAVFVASQGGNITVNQEGEGSVTGAGSYNGGAQVTLTATPADGYMFVMWKKDGVATSLTQNATVTCSGDATYTAVFKRKYQVTSTSADNTKGSASISPAPTNGYYYEGQNITLTATPANMLCSFVKWQKNGVDIQGNATMDITVSANDSYVAVFDGIEATEIDIQAAMTKNHGWGWGYCFYYWAKTYGYDIQVIAIDNWEWAAGDKVTISDINTSKSYINDHGTKVTFTDFTGDCYTENGKNVLEALVKGNNGKAYLLKLRGVGVDSYDATSDFIQNFTNKVEGPTGGPDIWYFQYQNGNGERYSETYWNHMRFSVDHNGTCGIVPTGIYQMSDSQEPWTVVSDGSNGEYYCQSSVFWVPASGYAEVVNRDEQYYIYTDGYNTYGYVYRSSMGTTPFSITGATSEGGHVDVVWHSSRCGDITYTTADMPQKFFSGNSITLKAVADEGYTFSHWADDENNKNAERQISVSATATYTAVFEKSVAKHDVTFKVEGQEDVIIQVAEGEVPVYPNAEPTKESTVDKVYTFSGWTPAITAVGSEDQVYTATFSETTRQYTITINSATNGTIKVMNGSTEVHTGDKVDYNTVLTVTATAAEHYHFAAWTNDGAESVTVTGDKTIGATFAIDQFTLTMDACENGTYTVKVGNAAATTATNEYQEIPNIAYGTSVTLSAEPADGYEFLGWDNGEGGDIEFDAPRRATMEGVGGGGSIGDLPETEGGEFASEENPYIFTMTDDVEYQAVFGALKYDITIAACEHGTIKVERTTDNGKAEMYNGAGGTTLSVAAGTELTLTATADEANHYEFKGWSVPENEQQEWDAPRRAGGTEGGGEWDSLVDDNPYTFTVSSAAEYAAVFGLEQITVSVTTANPTMGSVTVLDEDENELTATSTQGDTKQYVLDYGTFVYVKAVANTGYYFTNWSNNSTLNPYDEFEGEGDLSLTAEFTTNFQLVGDKYADDAWYTETYAPMKGKSISVTYVRTFVKDQWTSFSLPFNYSYMKDENQTFRGVVYELDNAVYDDGYLQLNFLRQTASIVANKPYVVHPSEEIVNPIFENVKLLDIADASYNVPCNSGHDVTYKNTLHKTTLDKSKNIIYLNQNKLYYPNLTKDTNMPAFRGFFNLNLSEEEIKHAPKIRIVVEGEEVMNLEDEAAEEFIKKYFDNEGNLIIENNGVKYDANGKQL